MLNKDNERELAYVVQVDEIKELPGYDKVESARVNGWWCIVPKNQFTVGSKGIYFEIDSLVDATNPAFAFMEKRKYKVKTQKMCKSISQGLLMSFSDLGLYESQYNVGDFLTKKLNVRYAEEIDNVRKARSVDKYKVMAQRHGKLFSKPFFKFLMKHTLGKKILFLFFGKKKDKKSEWPAWVTKTDEERIQNMPFILENNDPWIVTEKIDGTSTTFTMRRNKKKYEYYVCSRNVVFDDSKKSCFYDSNVYLEMSEKYHIEDALKDILDKNPEYEWVTIQGETYGEGIQQRDYSLGKIHNINEQISNHELMCFNFLTSSAGRWNSRVAKEYLSQYNIPWVPIIDTDFKLPKTVEEMLEYASGTSMLDGGMREGVVLRSQDGVQSFKAVSNAYLLKYHGN